MKRIKLHSFMMTLALVMMAGFWSCSNDDVESGGPFIEVTPSALAFENTGELTKSLAIKSNRDWTAAFVETGVDSWISIDKKSGNGDGTINVTVLANDKGERSATLKLVASTVSVTVRITQGVSVPTGDALYMENVGTSVEQNSSGKWPFVDQYSGWQKGGTLTQTEVTYGGSNASVRNTGSKYAPSDKTAFSDAPYIYMGSGANFLINNINITGKTNFTLSFAALEQTSYDEASSQPVFGAITSSTCKLSVSLDGSKWSELAFTSDGVAGWSKVKAEFKVPEGSTKLYVKIENGANQNRYDDFKLFEGGNGELIQPGGSTGGDTGEVDPYPTTAVTSFTEIFDDAVNNKPFTSSQWGFYSSDSKWPTDAYLGWHGRVFNNNTTGGTDKYLACAPYSTSLSEVVAYAIMAPFNVKDATSKTLTFDLAWFYQNADDSKIEVVASTDFAGNVKTATWTVLKNCTFASGTAKNDWFGQSVDLSENYANSTKVYVAFRYTGKDITYRLDNVAFGTELSLSFGTPTFTATTMKVGSAIAGGKITIPYSNAAGTETYNITVAVSGTGAEGVTVDAVNKTLSASDGSIEIPVTGTPTTAGAVTFTISGITELTNNTATATVAAESSADYTSNVSLPTADNSDAALYKALILIDGSEYPGMKLGTSSKVGAYTTNVLPATGNVNLSFYGVAWKGKKGTIKITVNNGGTIDGAANKTFDLQANNGATSNSPFTMILGTSDFYTVALQGITAASTLTIETISGTGLDPRAVLTGVNVK